MKSGRREEVTTLEILGAISDDISISMFNLIANGSETTNSLIEKIKSNRKQIHDRMTKLLNAGLVRRKKGDYSITSFGKLMYAIRDSDISQDEYRKFIDELIHENELKDMILTK